MARTGVILNLVAARCAPATTRVFVPGNTVAFGRRDAFEHGFDRARRIAVRYHYAPVIRHAGGRAVVYDRTSVVVESIRPEDQGLDKAECRFRELSSLIREALIGLGISLELGELSQEYCPGRFSLHLPGGPKVAGVAQRIIRGASLTTAVIAVESSAGIRTLTAKVYAALALPLDIATVGAVADRHPQVTADRVAAAIAASVCARCPQTLSQSPSAPKDGSSP